MQFNINTASLTVLIFSVFAAHAAPISGATVDLSVRQNVNPATNNGGRAGNGAAAGAAAANNRPPPAANNNGPAAANNGNNNGANRPAPGN